jgi:FkbM family methyltransferase
MIRLLNFLHRNGFYDLLTIISRLAYASKGRNVQVRYHQDFRGYEYREDMVSYISLGPGWAYGFDYLLGIAKETYNYYYMPKAGDVVFDIGAGLGEESVVYSQLVGPTGHVHAFEANPITCRGLKFMCEKNNFNWTSPHNLAIYNSNGEVVIEDDFENYLVNTIHGDTSTTGMKVRAITFDSFINQNSIKRVDFLKCNIEGAEQFLIEGMEKSLPMIHHLCISCHDFRQVYHQHGEFYMTREKVINFLKSRGFEVKTRETDNRVTNDYVYARNPNLN